MCNNMCVYVYIYINKYISVGEFPKYKAEQIAKLFLKNGTIYILKQLDNIISHLEIFVSRGRAWRL